MVTAGQSWAVPGLYLSFALSSDGDGGCSFVAAYRWASGSSLWAWSKGRHPSGAVLQSSRELGVRCSCSDFMDVLQRFINCCIIVIIIPSRGGEGRRASLLQVALEASWIGWYLEVRPHLPNLVKCQALQNQVLYHFLCTATVGTGSGVPVLAHSMMVVRCTRLASK